MTGAARLTVVALTASLLASCGDDGAAVCAAPLLPEPRGRCDRDADCATGVCRLDVESALDGEAATLACAEPAGAPPGSACDAADGCDHALCALAGSCVSPCRSDLDCAAADRCASLWVRAGDGAAAARGCVARVAVPARVSVSTAARTIASGRVDLPAATAETTLFFLDAPCADYDVERFVTDDGTVLLDAGQLGAGEPPLNTFNPIARPLPILFPSSPTAPPPPQETALELLARTGGEAGLTVLAADARGATLDLDLFYVGVRDWTPTGDRGPPDVEAALAVVESVLATAGIALGEVRQHLVTGDVAARLAVVDFERPGESRDRRELIELSAGLRAPGVSVFLVRVIDFGLGFSAAPGPHGIPGTELSGVAVAVELAGGADDLGRAIAHELGHHLGLFHTTEPDGRVVEPLLDTPVCTLDRDADDDGFLVRSECAGAGGENLMFWDHPGGLELSPDQIEILSRALVLR